MSSLRGSGEGKDPDLRERAARGRVKGKKLRAYDDQCGIFCRPQLKAKPRLEIVLKRRFYSHSGMM